MKHEYTGMPICPICEYEFAEEDTGDETEGQYENLEVQCPECQGVFLMSIFVQYLYTTQEKLEEMKL